MCPETCSFGALPESSNSSSISIRTQQAHCTTFAMCCCIPGISVTGRGTLSEPVRAPKDSGVQRDVVLLSRLICTKLGHMVKHIFHHRQDAAQSQHWMSSEVVIISLQHSTQLPCRYSPVQKLCRG
jgi:hypothetical protein